MRSFIVGGLLLSLACGSVHAQDSYPRLVLDFPLVDYPYGAYAAKTVSGEYPDQHPHFGGYLESYANPSMQQSLGASADLYAAAHYGLAALRFSREEYGMFNTMLAGAVRAAAEIALLYAPLGAGWLHEEYHRAVLTLHYADSFNGMNRFPIGSETVSVSRVRDEDLIRMKAESSADFVRMHAAGIEGEYMLVERLQRDNFFYRQNLPHFITYAASTLNSFYYVWMCHTDEAEAMTDEFNRSESDIADRDFTGLDFNAWAYDLFRPQEPYEARGIHPLGNGIDRYIKPSRMTDKELSYLEKQGYLQLINFLSPMMFGIDRIELKDNLYGNIAFRHLLTSFGTDISAQAFLQTSRFNWVLAAHLYQNRDNAFPGIETELIDYPAHIGGRDLLLSTRLMAWFQPEDQRFKTSRMSPGGLLAVKAQLPLARAWHPYVECTAKSHGWVAGNVFLKDNVNVMLGVCFRLGSKAAAEDCGSIIAKGSSSASAFLVPR